MIFVTVGSADCKGIRFDRLVQEMDRLAGVLERDVLIQHGTVAYDFRHARHVKYVPFDEARRQFGEAELVVGHCGAGTVLNALTFGKPLVVVPRRLEAGELDSDDHQMQLASMLEGRPGVRVVYDVEDLEEAVRSLLDESTPPPEPSPERVRMLDAIRGFIEGR